MKRIPLIALMLFASIGANAQSLFEQPFAGAAPRTPNSKMGDILSVKDGAGTHDDCVTDSSVGIQAAIDRASALGGGTVFLPIPASCYGISSTLTIPSGVVLEGSGPNTCIKPLAVMIDLIRFTGSIGAVRNLCVMNQSSRATNGVNFSPAVFGNNLLTVENVRAYSFVNNFYNTNADFFRILHSWSQNATGYDVRSVFSGTQSIIDDLQTLGSNAGVYFTPGASTTEGPTITNSNIIVTGTGKAIQFDQALFANITNTNVQGAVLFDGTTNAIANLNINGLYITPSSGAVDAIGIDFQGNIADININGLSSSGFSGCGLRLRSTASLLVQRVTINAARFLSNGTAANSADLCVIASFGAISGVTVGGSWFESTGGSVVSIKETNTFAITSSYLPTNTLFAGVTTTRLDTTPLVGTLPYINASQYLSYSPAIRVTPVAFASLPTPVEGMLIPVTDSNTAVWGATVAAGGANHILAYYNGSNWTVAGK